MRTIPALLLLFLAALPAAAGETVELPVLVRAIAPGEVIAAEDVAFLAVPLERARRDALADPAELVGKTPRRRLKEGVPLRAADLRRPVVVRKGDIVSLLYEAPGLVLTASGRALAEGGIGDTIPFMNDQSRRTLEARIRAPDLAVIAPRLPDATTIPDPGPAAQLR